METTRIGKRGTFVIPVKLRQRFNIKEGDLFLAEERADGILLRPAVAVPVEIYTPERKAEFFLNNAVTKENYDDACEVVRAMGLDPALVPNTDPNMRETLPTEAEFTRAFAASEESSKHRRRA